MTSGVVSKVWFVIFNGDKGRAATVTEHLFTKIKQFSYFLSFFVDFILNIILAFTVITGDVVT